MRLNTGWVVSCVVTGIAWIVTIFLLFPDLTPALAVISLTYVALASPVVSLEGLTWWVRLGAPWPVAVLVWIWFFVALESGGGPASEGPVVGPAIVLGVGLGSFLYVLWLGAASVPIAVLEVASARRTQG